MKTNLLYPLSYPITPNTNFYYFALPWSNITGSNLSELIQKYNIYIDTEIPITDTERILMDLKLYTNLGSNNKLNLQYKVLYQDETNPRVSMINQLWCPWITIITFYYLIELLQDYLSLYLSLQLLAHRFFEQPLFHQQILILLQ